jgi:hypothetical protein
MTGKFSGVDNAGQAPELAERKRRTTLDVFNDELSVLERPLESEVEYFDEAPPRSRWGRLSAFVAAAALTAGGSVMVMRYLPPKKAAAQPSPAMAMATAAAPSAPAAAPAAAPMPASAKPPAAAKETAVAEAPAEAPAGAAAEEGAAADEAPARQAPIKPAAWVKASHHASGHTRHSRADKAAARHQKHHR